MTNTRASRSRWWWGVLLSLPALSVCASSARASCGDYVHMDGKLPVAERDTRRRDASTNKPAPPHPSPAPCRGPSCEHRKPAAPLPVPAAPRPSGDRWACLTDILVLAPGVSFPFAPAATVNPHASLAEIFHPPRS